ncbi:MAG: hypothetical protein GY910_24095 [bacterium]|nr:hypothetical protein [Deltaproteobacteria bacterium]MCP4908065.1 hypothetical protein [bacterium]
MTTQLSFWQQILLLGLATLSLVYVLYFRIWLALSIGSDVIFAAALGLAIAGVATPGVFQSAASALVDRSPLPAALREADSRVATIEALPRSLIDRALAQIGYPPDEREETTDRAGSPEPGPFTSSVRPSVEALVSTVLRFASFACGSLLMLTSLALRSSTMTARKLQEFAHRIDILESTPAAGEPLSRDSLDRVRRT